MWIQPLSILHLIMKYPTDPTHLSIPRVYLWLPHLHVDKLKCPRCRKDLEKNGALPPRRIVDYDSPFYIVSWAYYCRFGCKKHYHGWNHELMNSLPAYIRHDFPAVLSRKGGISESVRTLLRVGNQHKMGPTGVQSLLFEAHTQRYNRILLQYLEMIYERLDSIEDMQENIQSYATLSSFPAFGNFSDVDGFNGFVPSVHYLSMMLNKMIEQDEIDANQHTACLPPVALCIDDSHKVRLLIQCGW